MSAPEPVAGERADLLQSLIRESLDGAKSMG